MEEQILPYYLKVFKLFIVITIISLTTFFYLTYSFINKKIPIKNNIINISKGEGIIFVIKKNLTEISIVEEIYFKFYYLFYKYFFSNIFHYGDFNIGNNISIFEFLNIISKPSNILNKITIIDGWSKYDLNNELSKYFDNFTDIEYKDILADTYYFEKDKKFDNFYSYLKKYKKNYLDKYKDNNFFSKYSENELIIIGSLIEKEGLDYLDKKIISSVIFNRLNMNMKLQIDATVLFSITKGKYKLNRNLNFNDLKINDPYNTYKINGLPPKPISYVSTTTIDIIMENYKTDYLFYFFNNSLNRHMFSINFKEHRKKLNEYRNKK